MRPTLAILTLALLACSPTNSTPPESSSSESPPADPPPVHVEAEADPGEAPIDARFTAGLLSAAQRYRGWGRVDERPNLAPMLCRAPMGLDYGFPSHARLSQADDAEHGRKLYYLFAGLEGESARALYTSLGAPGTDATIPIGFTVVKQSWVAEPSSPPAANPAPAKPDAGSVAPVFDTSSDPPAPIDWVEHEGQRLAAGEQAELFVMTKVGAADMPGTDAGWIYGTLSADGLSVTSAGRVQRCMDCHEAATHERLFGLQKTKALVRPKPSPWGSEAELPPELGLEP
ncbi:hypothetical protein ACNOYE_35625 [Nannocystaceae bacterium ST9]